MVFSSLEYLFVFLPFCIFLYYFLLKIDLHKLIIPVLFLASLFFYGYWKPENTWIIVASIIFNYRAGQLISKYTAYRKIFAFVAVLLNLLLLGYFKYTDFLLSSLNAVGTNFELTGIVLPIGISFFTFQQIAYIADVYSGKHNATGESFFSYCCFVCFFPQLIAGPIVHHGEMVPQFMNKSNLKVNWDNIYAGCVFLTMGLAKKVLIADNFAPIVNYCFDIAPSLSFMDAVYGSWAYSMQLYFDFSGYSDMAIGSALFFNIHLPQNFDSPYRAVSIQDFWRRWHMTLSRWLRDYLYIPLGGNRNGYVRTLINLFITFLLGGLWHGAAWTFVIWGAMHGAALVIHRVWSKTLNLKMPKVIGWALTFAFVNSAWIVFRATSFECVRKFIESFTFQNSFWFTHEFKGVAINLSELVLKVPVVTLTIAGAVLFFSKCDIGFSDVKKVLLYKKPLLLSILLISSIIALLLQSSSEFLYFQF